MLFPDVQNPPVNAAGAVHSGTEILVPEQTVEISAEPKNEERVGVVQLDIPQSDVFNYFVDKDGVLVTEYNKNEARAKIVERYTKQYGNLSPCVVIEMMMQNAVDDVERKKAGLRRIPRKNYVRLNKGNLCGSSDDESAKMRKFKTLKQNNVYTTTNRSGPSPIKKCKNRRLPPLSLKRSNYKSDECALCSAHFDTHKEQICTEHFVKTSNDHNQNKCPVCMVHFDTPKELHDHRSVCKHKSVVSNRHGCMNCSFSYRDCMILANHKQYHVYPYEIHFCHVCGLTFKKIDAYQRHRRIHLVK